MTFINRWHCFLFVFTLLALPAAADDAVRCAEHFSEKDYQSAYPVCKQAAEQGIAEAQVKLGLMYYNGEGVVQDKGEAVRWIRRAAEQGDASAQNDLGNMYYKGEGVGQDKGEAVRLFRQAAKQGHASAQYNLGNMYENGDGVVQDKGEAARWYHQAAEQGYARAQNNLGLMYDNGAGVGQDTGEAVRLFHQAAKQGHAIAQNNLGLMYLGVKKDPQEAYIWFLLAASNGNEAAGELKEIVEQELTASERATAIEEAKRRQQKISGN